MHVDPHWRWAEVGGLQEGVCEIMWVGDFVYIAPPGASFERMQAENK